MNRYAGVDDGFNTTITYTDKGELIIRPTKLRIGASHAIQMGGVNDSNLPAQYETQDNGKTITFSVNAQTSENIVHDDYSLSPHCRVMVADGLHAAKYLSEGKIKLCTGLPIKRFYKRNGDKNEALIKSKSENMLVPVKALERGEQRIVTDSHVMPESLSAIFDLVITERREPNKPYDQSPKVKYDKERLKSHMAFFDIGGRTTDIAIWAAGTINKGEFDTINAGMEDVYSEIREFLRDETGLDAIPDHLIKSAYKNRGIQLGGMDLDLTNVVFDAINETVAKIKNKAASVIGNKAMLIDEVAFLGGGSQELYESGLKGMYDNQFLMENPIAVNARSFYKWLRYVHSNESS